jgi:hypothetical protein
MVVALKTASVSLLKLPVPFVLSGLPKSPSGSVSPVPNMSTPEPLGRDPEGWDIYQSIKLAKRFEEEGVDLIDSSSGGDINGIKYPSEPMYQAQFSEMIKKKAKI